MAVLVVGCYYVVRRFGPVFDAIGQGGRVSDVLSDEQLLVLSPQCSKRYSTRCAPATCRSPPRTRAEGGLRSWGCRWPSAGPARRTRHRTPR